MLTRLESKPQGAVFTGTVEPSLAGCGSTWSLYKTDSGRRFWWAVTDDGRGSWWEEKPEEDWKSALSILRDGPVIARLADDRADVEVVTYSPVLLRKFTILGRVFVVDSYTIAEDGRVTLQLKPEVQNDATAAV